VSGRKYDSLGKVGKTAVDSDLKIDNRPKIFRTNNQRARINTLYILLPPPHALVPIHFIMDPNIGVFGQAERGFFCGVGIFVGCCLQNLVFVITFCYELTLTIVYPANVVNRNVNSILL